MIFKIQNKRKFQSNNYFTWLLQLAPSNSWKNKNLSNDGFPRWCASMHKILELELGPCGKDWSSRKYSYAKKLYIRFKDQSNMSLFLLKYT